MERYIIMAAGKSKRWEGDTPKQMVQIEGEPILKRTVRLLAEKGIPEENIYITLSEELDLYLRTKEPMAFYGYKVYGIMPKFNEQEIDRFYCCREAWGDETVFLYGDTYYTKEAIDTIVDIKKKEITFYGRKNGNAIKPYGEMFALRADTTRNQFLDTLLCLKRLEKEGKARGLGWDIHKAYGRINFVEIDSRVEDFDKQEDLLNFRIHYRKK